MNKMLYQAMSDWFNEPGAYILIDGQYGSTGKGVIAAALAECFSRKIQVSVSNAGPNSGHTSYFGDEKIVLKQLPTAAVIAQRLQHVGTSPIITYLDAGAVINPDILTKECKQYGIAPFIHPHAAIVDTSILEADKENVHSIASTGQGVGPALQRKLSRSMGAVALGHEHLFPVCAIRRIHLNGMVCFLEVPQGYSLGINSGFYPHVTARECTAVQALADAGLPPSVHRATIMSVRTYPIKVGSTENSSGPCYPDQEEISWADLGVEPELTTVTQRIRRVFTWSRQQFREALLANAPDVIYCNFMNYIRPGRASTFVDLLCNDYKEIMGHRPYPVLLGWGPRSEDIEVYKSSIGMV